MLSIAHGCGAGLLFARCDPTTEPAAKIVGSVPDMDDSVLNSLVVTLKSGDTNAASQLARYLSGPTMTERAAAFVASGGLDVIASVLADQRASVDLRLASVRLLRVWLRSGDYGQLVVSGCVDALSICVAPSNLAQAPAAKLMVEHALAAMNVAAAKDTASCTAMREGGVFATIMPWISKSGSAASTDAAFGSKMQLVAIRLAKNLMLGNQVAVDAKFPQLAKSLIQCAGFAEPKLELTVMMALEAFCREPQLHRSLVKQQALVPLVQTASNGATPQARSYAAQALVSIAMTSDDKATVIIKWMTSAKCFSAIVSQLQDDSADVVALAAKGIGRLMAAGGEPLKTMTELGVVRELYSLLEADGTSDKTRASAMSALGALGDGKNAAVGRELLAGEMAGSTMVSQVVDYLKQENQRTAAVELLAGLAQIEQLEEDMGIELTQITALLPALLISSDPRARRAAAKCAANLALHPDYIPVIGRSEIVDPLLRLLAPSVDLQTRRHAARAVSNLSANTLCRMLMMRSGTLNACLQLLKQPDQDRDLLCYSVKTIAAYAQAPIPDAASKLASKPIINSLLSASESRDEQVQRHAVITIAAISGTPNGHRVLVQCRVFETLAASCFGRDPKWKIAADTERYAVMAMANLAAFDVYHPYLQHVGWKQLSLHAKSGGDDMAKSLSNFWDKNMRPGDSSQKQMFFCAHKRLSLSP
jgi:hypothetical protein